MSVIVKTLETVTGDVMPPHFAEMMIVAAVGQKVGYGLGLKRAHIETLHRAGEGVRIECIEGRIWVTRSGRVEDIILEKGQSHEYVSNGLIVVEALLPAKVTLGEKRGCRG